MLLVLKQGDNVIRSPAPAFSGSVARATFFFEDDMPDDTEEHDGHDYFHLGWASTSFNRWLGGCRSGARLG